MARQQYKTVHTSLRTSRKLAAADHVVARLYFHILLTSDAYGTLSGDPWDVLHEAVSGVRGYDIELVAAGIDALVAEQLLERWTEPDGSTWLYVVKHDEILSASQRGKRGARSLPTPPSQQLGATRRNSPAAPTSQHEANSEAVGVSRRVSRGESPLTGDIPDPGLPLLQEVERQHAATTREERFIVSHERTGSARSEPPAATTSVGSEPLDATRRDLPDKPAAHPTQRPQPPARASELAAGLDEIFTNDARQSARSGTDPADTFAAPPDAGAA